MIEVEGLTKDYGTLVAVSDLSFKAKRGEVLGFLGANGAGKTTTLRMIAGALAPTKGRISIAGHDLLAEPIEARRSLGYMPEAAPLYPELRVSEYLMFRAALKGVRRPLRKANVERAMQRAKVDDVALVNVGHLSKGYRQRVALADTLVADPPLYILDEPTAGLDPNQIRETRQLIRQLAEQHTVLVSSHILSEIEELCDRALVIHKGRIVAEGKVSELSRKASAPTVVLRLRDPEQRATAVCADVEGVERVTSEADTQPSAVCNLTVHCRLAADVDALCEALVARLVQAGIAVLAVMPTKVRLEDIFAELTQEDGGAAPDPEGTKE